MRYLYTFAVVTPGFFKEIDGMIPASKKRVRKKGRILPIENELYTVEKSGIWTAYKREIKVEPWVQPIEERLYQALNEGRQDGIAYYRSILHGWSAAHIDLDRWVREQRPRAARLFQHFARTNGLLINADSKAVKWFSPKPSPRSLRRYINRVGFDETWSVLDALYEGFPSQKSTSNGMVITVRPVPDFDEEA